MSQRQPQPSNEALAFAKRLRLEPVQARFWAEQFDCLSRAPLFLTGSSKTIKAWVVFPVAYGSTRERMNFMPGVPASIWLVCSDGHALFLNLSRPVLDERQLEAIIAHCNEQLLRDLGSAQGYRRAENLLRSGAGIALSVRSISLAAGYDSPERLREYLFGRLFAGTKANPAVRRRVIDVLQTRLLSNMRSQTASFQQALDAEILQWMKQTGVKLDLETYNRWLNLVPPDAAYRRQTFRILPRLLRYLDDAGIGAQLPYAAPSRAWQSARDASLILSAIDRGQPLFKTLKRTFNFPEEIFRWLAKPGRAPDAESWPFDSQLLFHMLAQMAPEKRPASPQQWLCLRRMFEVGFERSLPLPLAMAWVTEASRRGLGELARKIANTPGYFNDLAQSADFFMMLALCVWSMPKFSRRQTAPIEIHQVRLRLGSLIGQTGLRRLLAASARWHRVLAHAYEEMAWHRLIVANTDGVPAPQSCWPALFEGEMELTPEIFAVCLHTTDELISEGRAMAHCVGQFTVQCLHYGSHIVSLRRRVDGKRLSTAELALVEETHSIGFYVKQHYEFHNRPATPPQQRALQNLLHSLTAKKHPSRTRQVYQAARIRAMQFTDDRTVDRMAMALMEEAIAPEWSLRRLAAQIFDQAGEAGGDLR